MERGQAVPISSPISSLFVRGCECGCSGCPSSPQLARACHLHSEVEKKCYIGTTRMLTSRYLTSTKNLASILGKVVDGTAPPKFTQAHLKSIGFKSSNDLGVIGLLKDLKFLTDDGTPTTRYHEYRDKSRSKIVMADAIRDAYSDLFHINEAPTKQDRTAIQGNFKSTHNVSDKVASLQTATFCALLELADLTSKSSTVPLPSHLKSNPDSGATPVVQGIRPSDSGFLGGLRYNIEIHLPATKDVEVFNAIFKSLKEHLLEY